jgi:hypothetical protein
MVNVQGHEESWYNMAEPESAIPNHETSMIGKPSKARKRPDSSMPRRAGRPERSENAKNPDRVERTGVHGFGLERGRACEAAPQFSG